MKTKTFKGLLASAEEAVAHHRGERRDLRTTVLPEPPRPMTSADIKKLRARINVSQPVFASCLNVSAKLVQAWESGTRSPEGSALKLLRIAETTPKLVFEFKEQAKASVSG